MGDAPWFDDLAVRDRRPILGLVVDIDEVFHHCSKALLRSQLWEAESWSPDAVPSRAQIAKTLERPDDSMETLEAYYGQSYAAGLY